MLNSAVSPFLLCRSGSVFCSVILILLQSPWFNTFFLLFQMEMLEYSSSICFLK